MSILGPEPSHERSEVLSDLYKLADMALGDKDSVVIGEVSIRRSKLEGLKVGYGDEVVFHEIPNGYVVDISTRAMLMKVVDLIRRHTILEELSGL